MSDFTQPLCEECWIERNGERQPVRLREAELERCCLCAKYNTDGIYTRIDPKTVPFPTYRGVAHD